MGGGRAVFGVLLGIAIVAAAVFIVRRWAPSPGHDIEWVHSESSIIVQMKTVENDQDAFNLRDTAPQFTLYGDGTLIVQRRSPQELPTSPIVPFEAHVSNVTIQSLLKDAKDAEFFNFAYKQPTPTSDSGATYLYFNSKLQANAVSAYGLNAKAPKDPKWKQFTEVQKLADRLYSIAFTADAVPLSNDKVVLIIRRHTTPTDVRFPPLPLPGEIDTSAVTADITEHQVDGGGVLKLTRQLNPGMEQVFVDDRGEAFDVAYRFPLPYEENFPEFEPPPQ